jgi:hypothetical protein
MSCTIGCPIKLAAKLYSRLTLPPQLPTAELLTVAFCHTLSALHLNLCWSSSMLRQWPIQTSQTLHNYAWQHLIPALRIAWTS